MLYNTTFTSYWLIMWRAYVVLFLVAVTQSTFVRGQTNETAEGNYRQLVPKSVDLIGGIPDPGSIKALSEPRNSNRSIFKVSARSELDPIVISQFHSWILHVESMDGQPVENAAIQVSGGMPLHDHDLPTLPEVTRYLGKGDYQVEGMNFQMPGVWYVMFYIQSEKKTDTAVFELLVE